MKTINLKDYYAHISIDTYIDIPDEVLNIFEEYRKAANVYAHLDYNSKISSAAALVNGLSLGENFYEFSPK